jgi:hypothetical protein
VTEERARYDVTDEERPPRKLPNRAYKLARRIWQLEQQLNGRGRLTFDVIFLDGEWLLMFNRPGELERLGE